MRRVVITGMGAATPVGNTMAGSLASLLEGRSGTGPVTGSGASGLPWTVAGELKGFDPAPWLSVREQNRLDPFIWYAVAASVMALEDAALARPDEAGAVIGSSRGGVRTLEKAARSKKISPYAMSASTVGMAASCAAQKCRMKGHSFGVSSACASGLQAVGEAFRIIKHAQAEVLLCGGAEAPVTRLCLEGYGRSRALSKTRPRPFGIGRDGFVLAEGAAMLVLEELGHALARGARVYGEILGYGNSADAFHETRPSAAGEARAMRAALREAGLAPDDIDLVSAHATGTPLGDQAEEEAINKTFGWRAPHVPVIALKGLTGHMLAASGPFEAAATILFMRGGVLPPYPHLGENGSSLSVSADKRTGSFSTALVNSFGFGGMNASIVVRTL